MSGVRRHANVRSWRCADIWPAALLTVSYGYRLWRASCWRCLIISEGIPTLQAGYQRVCGGPRIDRGRKTKPGHQRAVRTASAHLRLPVPPYEFAQAGGLRSAGAIRSLVTLSLPNDGFRSQAIPRGRSRQEGY